MGEKQRLERKIALARNALTEYEDRLSDAELTLLRLDSLPPELQEESHDAARSDVCSVIERCKVMIRVMREQAGPPPNRSQRRNGKGS